MLAKFFFIIRKLFLSNKEREREKEKNLNRNMLFRLLNKKTSRDIGSFYEFYFLILFFLQNYIYL